MKRDRQNLSTFDLGAESGTAAVGRTKAEAPQQMDAVVERGNLLTAYALVMMSKGAPEVNGLTLDQFEPKGNPTSTALGWFR